jgi:hypothetical protein
METRPYCLTRGRLLGFRNTEDRGSLPSLPQKIKTHGLGPRDFVLLVRERAVGMLRPWSRRSVRRGSPLRNEASTVGDITLQELFSDELSTLLVSVLRLALTAHAGRHRTDGQEAIGALRGINAHDGAAQARFVKLSENTAGELLCGARPATVAG